MQSAKKIVEKSIEQIKQNDSIFHYPVIHVNQNHFKTITSAASVFQQKMTSAKLHF